MARPTSRVSRVLMTGPLATFADAYRVELSGRGYTPLSTVTELRQAARFSGPCVLESDLWLLDRQRGSQRDLAIRLPEPGAAVGFA